MHRPHFWLVAAAVLLLRGGGGAQEGSHGGARREREECTAASTAHECLRPAGERPEPYRPEDRLPQPESGWDGAGGGWPTPLHVFAHHYQNLTAAPTLDKWLPYFEAYHRHLAKFRGAPEVVLVEVGVQSGGSMVMWRWFFGPGLKYIGIDVDPECRRFANTVDWAEIVIGDVGDTGFWTTFAQMHPSADVFIDDGSHHAAHQVATFRGYYHRVRDGGVYVVEDTHTAYWESYGGRADARVPPLQPPPGAPPDAFTGTFLDWAVRTIHWLHGAHIAELLGARAAAEAGGAPPEAVAAAEGTARAALRYLSAELNELHPFITATSSLHFYEGIVVYDISHDKRRARGPPPRVIAGGARFAPLWWRVGQADPLEVAAAAREAEWSGEAFDWAALRTEDAQHARLLDF